MPQKDKNKKIKIKLSNLSESLVFWIILLFCQFSLFTLMLKFAYSNSLLPYEFDVFINESGIVKIFGKKDFASYIRYDDKDSKAFPFLPYNKGLVQSVLVKGLVSDISEDEIELFVANEEQLKLPLRDYKIIYRSQGNREVESPVISNEWIEEKGLAEVRVRYIYNYLEDSWEVEGLTFFVD